MAQLKLYSNNNILFWVKIWQQLNLLSFSLVGLILESLFLLVDKSHI